MPLDENAADIDFEESLDRHPSASTSPAYSMGPGSLKQSLSMARNEPRSIHTLVCLEIDPMALVDHAAMAIDFKGEGNS